ncbi:hypothetical protein [Citrobacter meridianamericanus]|uniref:hypothetical protein n=1 Tax=Citrobacter meridianamericanus TaxID=2894201 RepID=UPI00351D4990
MSASPPNSNVLSIHLDLPSTDARQGMGAPAIPTALYCAGFFCSGSVVNWFPFISPVMLTMYGSSPPYCKAGFNHRRLWR